MKILFIIGNGFDINLGLKTKYTDFYKYYQAQVSNNSAIQNLKENISKDFKNWSDLEQAIGKYTENFKTGEDFINVYEDIGDNLGEYLIKQEEEFDFSNVKETKLTEYLAFPERSLTRADENEIITFKNQWAANDWKVQIITLNYTRSIEKIFGDDLYFKLGDHHRSKINLEGIEHIHGFADERMVMGVNDISQIKNQSFHTNQDLLDAMVKSECNKAYKHTIDVSCQSKVSSASLIVIYGSSIGDTDNCWWQLIGEQLKRGCHLIIFTKGEEISKRWGYKKAKAEREMIDYFFSKTTLNDEQKASFRKLIFIGVNSTMFGELVN